MISLKANAVNNLTDARYFAAFGVEWLGFDFNPSSPTFSDISKVAAIREWLDGVKIVGEFHHPTIESLQETNSQLPLDAIQVDFSTPLDTLLEWNRALPVFKEILIPDHLNNFSLETEVNQYAPYVDFFLLNFNKYGIKWNTAIQKNVSPPKLLFELGQEYNLFFAIDINPTEIKAFVDVVQPYGFCIQGGEEEKVGYKSFDELDEILEALTPSD